MRKRREIEGEEEKLGGVGRGEEGSEIRREGRDSSSWVDGGRLKGMAWGWEVGRGLRGGRLGGEGSGEVGGEVATVAYVM